MSGESGTTNCCIGSLPPVHCPAHSQHVTPLLCPVSLCLQRRTALHLAAWAGHVDCVKALLAAGADHNADAQDAMNAL